MQIKLLIPSLLLLLSGCTIHSGTMTGNASLSSNNFKIIKNVEGYAGTTHILFVGGHNKSGLVANAKQDLYQKANLQTGQALANVTVDFKRSFYLIAARTDVFINADVVDFNTNKATITDTINGKESNITKEHETKTITESYNGFKTGQNVLFKKGFTTYTGTIVDLKKTEAIVEYIDNEEVKQTKAVPHAQLHSAKE